jgi:hypothetical protein
VKYASRSTTAFIPSLLGILPPLSLLLLLLLLLPLVAPIEADEEDDGEFVIIVVSFHLRWRPGGGGEASSMMA